jgi:hypothetical protein
MNELNKAKKHLKLLIQVQVENEKSVDNAYQLLRQTIEKAHFVEQQISAVKQGIKELKAKDSANKKIN